MPEPKNNPNNKDFKTELSGSIYQVKILLLFLWRAWKHKYTFSLATEIEEAEKFDDLVFYYKDNQANIHTRYLQAKSSTYEGAKLKYDAFVSDLEKKPCNLDKYFLSFRKIKQRSVNECLDDFIICISYKLPQLILKGTKPKHLLKFIEETSADVFFGDWKRYKLDENVVKENPELMEKFENATNLSLLAEEMVDCVLKNEPFNLKNFWFSCYHCPLLKSNVITKQEVVSFKKAFIDDPPKNSKLDILLFRQCFMEECVKRTHCWEQMKCIRLGDNLKIVCKTAFQKLTKPATSLDLKNEMQEKKNVYYKLAKALAKQIFDDEQNDLNKLLQESSEALSMLKNVIVVDEEFAFSDDFISGNFLCEIMINFCSLFQSNYETEFKTELQNQRLTVTDEFKILLNLQNNHENDTASEFHDADLEIEEKMDHLANELSSCVVHGNSLSSEGVFKKNLKFLRNIFEANESGAICFESSFIQNNSTEESVKKFYECLLTSCALKKLKDVFNAEFKTEKSENIALNTDFINMAFENKTEQLNKVFFHNLDLARLLKNVIRNVGNDYFEQMEEQKTSIDMLEFRQIFTQKYKRKIFNTLRDELIPITSAFETKLDKNVAESNKSVKPKVSEITQKNELEDVNKNDGEHLKRFAKELALHCFYQQIMDENIISNIDPKIVTSIFQPTKMRKMKFISKFTKEESLSDKQAHEIREDFLTFYVAEKLKNAKLSFVEAEKNVFVENFAEFIVKNVGTNNDAVFTYDKKVYEKNGIKEVIEMLAENVFDFIDQGKTAKFKAAFFENVQDLSKVVKDFKQKILEMLHKKAFSNLLQYRIEIVNNSSAPSTETTKINEKTIKILIEEIFTLQKQSTNNNRILLLDETKNPQEIKLLEVLTGTVFENDGTQIKIKERLFEEKNPQKNTKVFMEVLEKMLLEKPIAALKETEIKFSECPYFCDKSGMQILAKVFFQLFEFTKLSGDKTLVYDRSIYGKNETKGLIEALSGSVFLSTGEKDKIKFRSCFFDNEELSISAKLFKAQMISIFGIHFNEVKQYNISICDFPFCCDRLIENGDINDDIKEFCHKLLLVTSPYSDKLLDDVEKELGKEINLLDANIPASDLLNNVLEWAKSQSGKVLTRKKADSFLAKLKNQISSLMLSGYKSQYCQTLKNTNISLIEEQSNWEEFLKPCADISKPVRKQILHLLTDEILLTSIKMEQSLQKISYYESDDSFIFSSLSSLVSIENSMKIGKKAKYFSKAFESKTSHNLLVIAVDQTSENVSSFLIALCKILKENDQKKILIISESEDLSISDQLESAFINAANVATSFSEHSDNSGDEKAESISKDFEDIYETQKDDIAFKGLPKQTQVTLLKKRINFQGKDIALNQLIDDESLYGMIDVETLKMLVTDEHIGIAKRTEWFKKTDSYIKRQISLVEISGSIFKNIEELKNHFFAIEGETINAVEEFLTGKMVDSEKVCNADTCLENLDLNEAIFITMVPNNACKTFAAICEKLFACSVHWLKLDSHKLLWQETYAPFNSKEMAFDALSKYVKQDENFTGESSFLKQNEHRKVIIISDLAGMGKSTVLSRFAEMIDSDVKIKWIVRINLNQYTKVLSALENPVEKYNIDFGNFNNETKDYGELILKSLCRTDNSSNKTKMTFENFIFLNLFKCGKIALMFDGYDEISSKYESMVLLLLERLKDYSKNQIWITTRKNFQKILEQKLCALGCCLKPLSEKEQIQFLQNYWTMNWIVSNELSMLFLGRTEIYTKFCLKIFGSYYMPDDTLRMPLVIKMMAEVFQENKGISDVEEKWDGCFDFAKNEEHIPVISKEMASMVTLFKNFIKKKIYGRFLEEKAELDSTKVAATEIEDAIFFQQNQIYKIIGFVKLLGEEKHIDLPTENELKDIYEWKRKFKAGSLTVGIVDRITDDDKILFNHSTYAEYFAALYLYDKIFFCPKTVFDIMNKMLQEDAPMFHLCIMNLLKEQKKNTKLITALEGTTLINFAAKYGYYTCVEHFLMNDFLSTDYSVETDESGKMLLHYASENGQIMTVIHILLSIFENIDDVNSAGYLANLPDNQNKTPIDYATENGHLQIMHLLDDIKAVGPKYWKSGTRPILIYSAPDLLDKLSHSTFFSVISKAASDISEKPNKAFSRIISHISSNSMKIIFENLHVVTIQKYFADENIIWLFLENLCLRKNLTVSEKTEVFECLYKQIGNFNNLFIHLLFVVTATDSAEMVQQCFRKMKRERKNWSYVLLKTACTNRCVKSFMILKNYLECDTKALKNALRCQAPLIVIKYLCEHLISNINEQDETGMTTILEAAKHYRKIHVIKYLIEKGANVNICDFEGRTVWDYVVENDDKDILEYFFKCCCEEQMSWPDWVYVVWEYYNDETFNINFKHDNKSRLHHAIADENIILANFLIKKGADVNAKDENIKSPLHYLCELNLLETEDSISSISVTFSLLVIFGARFDELDRNNRTPHDYCVFNNNISEHLKELSIAFKEIEKEWQSNLKLTMISFSARNQNGQTLWHIAVNSGDIKNVLNLKNSYPSRHMGCEGVNICDIDGNTPLHLAVYKNDHLMIRNLLKCGACYNLENGQGKMPIIIAEEKEVKFNTPFLQMVDNVFQAAKQNRFQEIKKLMQSGKSMFGEMTDITQELNSNMFAGSTMEKMKDTLTMFFDVKASDNDDDLLEILMHTRNKDGKLLFHFAVINGNVEIAKEMLVRNLTLLDREDFKKRTAFSYAVENNDMEMVKTLLKFGTKCDKKQYKMCKPNPCTIVCDKIDKLFRHMYNEEFEAVNIELNTTDFQMNLAIIVNTRDDKKISLFEYALATNDYDLVVMFLKNGATVIEKEISNRRHINDLLDFVRSIFDKVRDRLKFDNLKSLINTIEQSNHDLILTNVQYHTNESPFLFPKQTTGPTTLLLLAAAAGKKELIEWCYENGADMKAEDLLGVNAIDLAKANGCDDIATFLENIETHEK